MRELPPTAGLPLRLPELIAGILRSFNSEAASFEQMLADFLEVPEVDIYSSGTLCLSLAFETLKEVTGRKRVIIPAYSCPLVPIAARAAGVEVVLCDTQKESPNFDLSCLEQICNSSIAAVVPTDLAGLPQDLAPIRKIAQASGAYVVEDAAQALGARINGRPVGRSADMAVYSLGVGKGLSLFDGGILAVQDAQLRAQVREVGAKRVSRQPQMNALRIAQLFGLCLFYNPLGLTLAYGRELRRCLAMGDLLRAVGEQFDLDIPAYEFENLRKQIGAVALGRLPEFVLANRQRGLARREVLSQEFALQVLTEADGAEGNWPFLLLLAESEKARDRIMDQLWLSGLGVTRLFIHDLTAYDYLRDCVPPVQVPNARSFAQRSFSITNSSWLNDRDFTTIVQSIRKAIEPVSQRSLVSSLQGDRL